MSLKTRYNLYKAQKSLSPSSDFKADLSKKLNTLWNNKYNVKYSWYQTVWFKHATVFASVVLVVGSLGTGAYAYTSPTVTEGSVLYPIKNQLESIEEIAQITPEAKARFYLKKIERREVEREILTGDDLIVVQSTSTILEIETEPKSELRKKNRINIINHRIEKIEKSIEDAEDQLEIVQKNINENDLQNIQLRENVRERLKVRSERKRERLENKLEDLKNREEKLRDGIKLEDESRD